MKDQSIYAERLSAAVQFKTVSGRDGIPLDEGQFLGFRTFLEEAFPRVHATLTREVVDGYSLLYYMEGSDPSLDPFCLMAHMDVVPVDERTADQWLHPGFSGDIADGYVWGRGTLDMKGQLISIFSALENLLECSFQPRRSFYIALSHNEEIMSQTASGALRTANTLRNRGVRLSFVLDEGGNFFPPERYHTDRPAVLLGVCERGYADVKLTAASAGGHSSTPPRHTALGTLCAAVARIENDPLPPFWNPAATAMLDALAPHMEEPYRAIFMDRAAHGEEAADTLLESPFTRALITCTAAATMAEGSAAPNVLPNEASMTFNLRISPTSSVARVTDHMKSLAGDGVAFTELAHIEPSPISPMEGTPYETVKKALSDVFPEYIPVPGPVIFGTDSRHYYAVTDCVYHVTPFPSFIEDGNKLHTVNERLSLDSLLKGVEFFSSLIESAAN